MPCEQCRESYLDSYNVAVDTLKRENPVLSAHEVRIQAALRFRPNFHAMQTASSIENAGMEEYENGEFAVTPSGEMYYPNIGVTAEQLHTNQLRSSEITRDPTKYSVTDHQTTRLIQYAIAQGATVVRTSFARDGQNNQDVLEYRYDKLTNRGVIKVINTAKNGVQHDFDSIKEITRQGSEHLTEVAPLEKVFIFTDIQLQQDNAQSVVHIGERRSDHLTTQLSQKDSTPSHPFRDGQLSQKDSFEGHTTKTSERASLKTRGNLTQVVDITGYAMRSAFRDTHETIKSVSLFIENKNVQRDAKDRILTLPVVEQIRRLFHIKDSVQKQGEEKHKETKQIQPTRFERLTLSKIREKPMRVREIVRKRHQEMRQTITALAIVADTRVGIAAIPLLIGALAKELPQPVKAVGKSIGRHERKMRRIKKKELRIMRKRKEEKTLNRRKAIDQRSGELLTKQSKEKKKRPKTKERHHKKLSEANRATYIHKTKPKERKSMRLVELVRHRERKRRTTEKKEQQKIYLERSVRKPDIALWKTLARLARKLEKDEKGLLHASEGGTQKRKEKTALVKKETRREFVTRLSFAWVLWLLFDVSRFSLPRGGNKELALKGRTFLEKREGVEKRNQTPWILLSIIWYLTMLRESRSAGQKVYSKKGKKMKSVYTSILPNQAIIFAYGS